MGKKDLKKKLDEIKHPGSRKTLAAIRDIKKIKKRENIKVNFISKANAEGKKLSFFSEHIEGLDLDKLSPQQFEDIIEKYFHRFDDELAQINLKTQINKRRQTQHSNRESAIKIQLEMDVKNFNAGGIELPDLCDPEQFKIFKAWDGNSHDIQHIKLKFISKKSLSQLKEKVSENVESEMNTE